MLEISADCLEKDEELFRNVRLECVPEMNVLGNL